MKQSGFCSCSNPPNTEEAVCAKGLEVLHSMTQPRAGGGEKRLLKGSFPHSPGSFSEKLSGADWRAQAVSTGISRHRVDGGG